MKHKFGFMLFAAIIMSLSFSSCLKRAGEKMMDQLETIEEEITEAELSEVEESGTQMGLDEVFDEVRMGVHLVMGYDAVNKLFTGYVKNTTAETIDNVRVEIHLSNGVELGPVELGELPVDEKVIVEFNPIGEKFETWSVHAEVGSGEHGEDHEEGEHAEGGGEHH